MDFSTLGLSAPLAARLAERGIQSPTEIQKEAFPLIVSGKSVLGFSKTGSGKTFAYMMPLVEEILRANETSRSKILVLVPTRELATQVSTSLELLTGGEFKSVVVVGGEAEDRQVRAGQNADWIIATPGRLLDLIERKLIDPAPLKAIVFDEADRLLDMGFLPDIRRLFGKLPKPSQMCFFSATLHFGVDELSYEFGAECERIGQEPEEATVEGLDHRVAFVGDHEKFHALVHFLNENPGGRGIVFSNYRERAHDIAYRLKGLGIPAAPLTAQLSQGQRTAIMQDFRDRKIPVLLGSDLAARGLDVEGLDFVVNFDLPEDPPTYIHRVGRTARAGRSGKALSLVGFEDAFRLEKLESFLGKPIERETFALEKLQGTLPRFGPAIGGGEADVDPSVRRQPGDDRAGGRGGRDGGRGGRDSGRRDGGRGGPRGGSRGPDRGGRRPDAPAQRAAPAHSNSAPRPLLVGKARPPGHPLNTPPNAAGRPVLAGKARPPATVWTKFTGWLRGLFGAPKGKNAKGSARVGGRTAGSAGAPRRSGPAARTTSTPASTPPARR